jgi:hypothetical protein
MLFCAYLEEQREKVGNDDHDDGRGGMGAKPRVLERDEFDGEIWWNDKRH